jgi:hypothetical protein
MQHINRSKYKNYMIISIGAEKVFDKFQHLFIIIARKPASSRRSVPQRNKATYKKPIVNIILNADKL